MVSLDVRLVSPDERLVSLDERLVSLGERLVAIASSCSNVSKCRRHKPRGWFGIEGRLALPSTPLISIVDDDEDFRAAITDLLRTIGLTVEAFPSAADFLASPNMRDTSCLIADVHMPRMTGIELQRHLVESGNAVPTILVTAYPDESDRARALENGVICYLTKPVDGDGLLGCVSTALERTEPGEHH
jgi:CheY-like chemotaxis protein